MAGETAVGERGDPCVEPARTEIEQLADEHARSSAVALAVIERVEDLDSRRAHRNRSTASPATRVTSSPASSMADLGESDNAAAIRCWAHEGRIPPSVSDWAMEFSRSWLAGPRPIEGRAGRRVECPVRCGCEPTTSRCRGRSSTPSAPSGTTELTAVLARDTAMPANAWKRLTGSGTDVGEGGTDAARRSSTNSASPSTANGRPRAPAAAQRSGGRRACVALAEHQLLDDLLNSLTCLGMVG